MLDINGNIRFGLQAKKVTIKYNTDTNRTVIIPNISGDRTFSFIDQDETINSIKTFSNTPIFSADSATLNFSSTTGTKQITTGGTTNLKLSPGGKI
jgi:hypothetical protein